MQPSTPAQPAAALDRFDLIALGLLLLVAGVFLIPPLWTPGIVNPGDFLMSVHRVLELDSAWQSGIYYPRIGSSFNFGYGAPLFQYYPPLSSYVALVFHTLGFGFIAAAKAVLSLSLLLGGTGVYFFGRHLLGWRPAALAAGLLYLASPYLLLVVYERGAVAEMLVWGLAPWLFWAAHRTYTWGARRDALITALLVAAVFLAHNATALFVIPLVALYIALLALGERRWRAMLPVAAAFVLGAALSAFYWAPAMVEARYTDVTTYMFQGATAAVNNVVAPANVMQHTWVPQFTGSQRFQLSLWQFVLGIVGAIVALLQGRRAPLGLRLLAGGLLLLLLLQTTWSIPFWEHVPLVRYIQFPWRLHGLISLCVAVLAGGLLLPLQPLRAPLRTGALVAAAVGGALLIWLGTQNMAPQQSEIWVEMGEEEINRLAMWERGRSVYPLWVDYTMRTLPIGSIGLINSRAPDDPSRLPATSTPQITILSTNPSRTQLAVRANESWNLRLHSGWFPGWQVRMDGKAVPTTADGDGGIVGARLPAGNYTVDARFEDSSVRLLANLVSILAIGIWTAWAFKPSRAWMQVALALAVALGVALLVRFVTVDAKPALEPQPLRAEFDNGVTLVGYDLDLPRLCAGETAHLRTWWHARETPPVDFKYFIHLITPDDTARVAQFDAFPSDGYIPMTRWEAGELVPDAQQIVIDESVPAGTYSLLFGLYDAQTGQNARVRAAPDVLPGDRLRLTSIEVTDCAE